MSSAAASGNTKAESGVARQPQKMQSAAETEKDCDEVLLDDELVIEPAVPAAGPSGRICSQEDVKQPLQELDIDWSRPPCKGLAQASVQRHNRASLHIPKGNTFACVLCKKYVHCKVCG